MFVWLTLPDGLDANALLAKAIALEGVAFVTGRPFHPDGSGRNTLRLCFTSCPPERAQEGIKRLSRLITDEMADLGSVAPPEIVPVPGL
jgi:DNA-binding transcriptional MocR family regulator